MITMKDIHMRLKVLPESGEIGSKYRTFLEASQKAIESENPDRIIKMIESGINDTTNSFLFETMVDLFDNLYLYGNSNQVKYYGQVIAEKYVQKVRDAKDTQTNIKRKISRIKTAAVTKANSNIEDITAAIKSAINAAKGNFNANTSKMKANLQSALPQKKEKPAEQKAKLEAYVDGYQAMLDQATVCIYCDRILENYNRISKRFNIDKIIQEGTIRHGIYDTVVTICRLMETYDVPDSVKYNTVLESLWYGYNKNYITVPSTDIVTPATDYFLSKGNSSYMCSRLLEASMIVTPKEYNGEDLELIQEEEPEENETYKESYIQEDIRDHINSKCIPNIDKKPIKEETDFNKIFNQFKVSDEEHKETKLQWLVRKIYSKNPQDVINGTPSLLGYIRVVFVLGTLAINPVLGAVNAIAQVFLSLHTERSQTEAMLKCFRNEIAVSQKKLADTKDPTEKTRLKSYIKELKVGVNKIDEYYETQLTDAELDKKYDSDSDAEDTFANIVKDDDNDEGNSNDLDDDFDFDDDDFNFDESFIIAIGTLAERYDALAIKEFTKEDISNILSTAGVYNELAELCINVPGVIDPEIFVEIVKAHLDNEKARAIQNESSIYTVARTNMNSALNLISYADMKPVPNHSLVEKTILFAAQVEALKALNEIKVACDYYHPLVEGSFTNTIALASEKVKKAITKLSDKEKTISRNIDMSANNAKKAMEKALTNDNREAVIKGSVLPSASKTIKLALAGAGLCLLDPVIAVIGALGYIGVSKGYKAKERQMVLDEIEIEIKMCEKYIDIAESKNDMKALKQLLTIQRELERQRQRIKYNMKVKFGQKYYDSANAPAPTANGD